jgi:hypothetical protein
MSKSNNSYFKPMGWFSSLLKNNFVGVAPVDSRQAELNAMNKDWRLS